MSRARPDFVDIRLSAAGKRLAGDHGVVRFANSRRHFEFRADQVHEVERSFEWQGLLRHERYQGEAILEEVPEADDAGEVSEVSEETEAGDEQSAGRRKRKG